MKQYIHTLLAAVAVVTLLGSCVKDELNENSVIKVTETEKNDFDRWLEANFLLPYNIAFKYRFEINESNMNYFEVPAKEDWSIVMAHLVKYLCVESYDEVAGIAFTRTYFPKMFFLTGTWEYRNNGTIILGTAEGGKKIFLAGINFLEETMTSGYGDRKGDPQESLNHYYIKTIHHEFTHILNQQKEYPVEFQMITGGSYVADSWSESPYNKEYLQNGFITAYAQHSDTEDFAEMVSEFITHNEAWWAEQITNAGEKGRLINAKLDVVRKYMKDSFNIDLDQLRATVLRRQKDVFDGQVDLHSVKIQ